MSKSPELKSATQRALCFFDNANIGADPFEKALDIAQGTIKNLKNGKNLISADCIIKFSRYFNISADYLLCLTDEPKPLETIDIVERPIFALSTELENLSKDKDFVNSAKLYNAVSSEYKKQICAYILGVATTLGLNITQILGK